VTAPVVDRSLCRAARHGEYWMRAKYGCRCFDARLDESVYRRARRRGERLVVDATAARRIAQGLACHGYNADQIATLSGLGVRTIYELQSGRKTTLQRRKDQALREAADRMPLDQYRTGWDADRARLAARRNGWVPLAAWDDDVIDDPAAVPAADAAEGDIDTVAVSQALKGVRLRLTAAEQAEALRLGLERGEPLSKVAATLHLSYAKAREISGLPAVLRERKAEMQAEVVRLSAAGHGSSAIGALIGVHHQTVIRARRRIAERQEQLAS
jgi:hypothetical protein